MKKLLALILALVMCFSLVACGGDKKDDEAANSPAESAKPSSSQSTLGNNQSQITEADKTVKYEEWVWGHYGSDLDTADPYGSTSAQHQMFTNMTFDVVTYVDADTGELMPELAYKWEPNADNTEWTFYLEEGVVFHNGNKFTADDVKFTWEYAGVNQGNVVKPISAYAYCKEIVVVDEHTVKFVLNSGMPDFATYLEMPIYDKESFDTMDAKEAAVIGTGPYYYDTKETVTGSHFVATRNEDYWRGLDNYPTKHIGFKVIGDANSVAAALENGEIDFAGSVTSATYPTLETNKKLKMYSRAGASSYYMGFNYAVEKMNDINIRKALCQAIDKDAIVAIAYEGGLGGVANGNFVVPTGLGYTADTTPLAYDPAAAKAVLEPINLELTIIYYASCAKIAEVIQQCFAQVGVKLNLEQKDGTNWTPIKAAQEGYDLFLDYAAYQGALLYNFNRFFYSGGSSNVYGFQSDEYEALQDKVQQATTYEDMLKEFAVLQQWVIDNLPIFPLTISNVLGCAQADVEGLYYSPTTNYHDFSTVRIPARG